MKTLIVSWEAVALETDMNCFILGIVYSEALHAAVADSIGLFKDPQKSFYVRKAANLDTVLEALSGEIVIDVDHDFFCNCLMY